MADAYYALWVLRRRRVYVVAGDTALLRKPTRAEIVALDSLPLLANLSNPFFDNQRDFPNVIPDVVRARDNDPASAGILAYARRDFRRAVALWATALKNDREAFFLHLPRAYAWFRLSEVDSAISDLNPLVERIEQIQRDSLTAPYLSKASLLYSIGMLQATQHRVAESRAAYQRALTENLGFYMAHVRLAGSALAEHDTATALGELESAIVIRADDPFVDTYYRFLLLLTHHDADAERQLRAAITADSDYALPHHVLARALEARHDTTASIAAYERYLVHAKRDATEVPYTMLRLGALKRR
ncbi:MAG: hypothetical protein M3081_05485 [Gemmatimonadota bacterium]|nr:hypothetical protein [Gemmatimonadota bacterium]